MYLRTPPVLALIGIVIGAAPVRADLNEYVKRPEPKYSWKLKEKQETAAGTVYDLHLVSQTWHDIVWEHQVQVYMPKDVQPNATMLLYNTGGGASPRSTVIGLEISKRVKAPTAILYHIPNQPLFDGKKEDALIAETYVRFLATKDETWPLLFPMVKSVVKCMDALQEFSEKEWKKPVKQFIISGGSKRGWTTWLTAASGDPRVKAIAPAVIDTLKMHEQMPHQYEAFGGKYSEQIKDYTERGLVPMPDTAEAKKLSMMVDPWFYREKLTLPKFIVNGSNDPYWATDALNLYWDDLKGDKWVMYVPNAGHNLQRTDKVGLDQFSHVIDGLAAYVLHMTKDNPMPQLRWKHDDNGGKARVSVETSEAPKAARLWLAKADTHDFRKAKWEEQPVKLTGKNAVGEVTPPTEGCAAFYVEMDYEIEGIVYHLSTQLRIVGKNK